MSPQKRKALDLAIKNSDHPIFAREDIKALAEAAFDGEEYLHPFELSAEEIDQLMSGLNIAREY